MEWLYPKVLLLAIPAVLLLVWFDSKSVHSMPLVRRRILLVVRCLCVLCVIGCLASPARLVESQKQAVVFVVDYSRSVGAEGVKRAYQKIDQAESVLDGGTLIGIVAAGETPQIIREPQLKQKTPVLPDLELTDTLGAGTNLEKACQLARAIFPADASKHIILLSDGIETQGSLIQFAKQIGSDIQLHAIGVAGNVEPDVRVTRLEASQTRVTVGAALELEAKVDSSISGQGRLLLYENGIEDDTHDFTIQAGETYRHIFKRSPNRRNIYSYKVRVEGFEGQDSIPENNEAQAIVDVRGEPIILYAEGEESESRYLIDAMAREGIQLEYREPLSLPNRLQDYAGYDAVILSDVAAHELGENRMSLLRDYVEKLGGGLVMIGGVRSFGVGGYYRSPIEELLPVKLKAPDREEDLSSALALVIDRSGSMKGSKIEVCKSAAIATTELLTSKDYIGIYAFDAEAHEIVPMTKVVSTSSIANQIASIGSGGGTNIYPAIVMARQALTRVKAKTKHMIVLTDGETGGDGYQSLAAQCQARGITISTVAVGSGAQKSLLQTIAAAGGGAFYATNDPNDITRIFTQDTMVHTSRMIREATFQPNLVESHPMLRGWELADAPPLLGYVKTNHKATAQIPLVTDQGDPLLAHWRFGFGKVTAFTSDCKSRWAALWVLNWDGYSQMWAQILTETARPPQGRNLDVRVKQVGDQIEVSADLLSDAATRKNGAQVNAEVFYVPARSSGANLKAFDQFQLDQRGPGLYQSRFRPSTPGVYMIRVSSGIDSVSVGYVHQSSNEVATGKINEQLLMEVSRLTGGQFLDSISRKISLNGKATIHYSEMWTQLLLIAVGLFLIDVVIRRWQSVLRILDFRK